MARRALLSFTLSVLVLTSGCANSRVVGDVQPVARLCCEDACMEGLNRGNICGVSYCADRPYPLCQSLDLPGEECAILYSNCDEGGDCPADEVCRTAEDGGNYYACQPPIEHYCDYPDTLLIGCRYACRGDADCPPGASRCVIDGATEGACGEVGFCES
jgi:hypothetical protein